MKATGVDRVVVDRDHLVCRIVGPTTAAVAAARAELEYAALHVTVRSPFLIICSFIRVFVVMTIRGARASSSQFLITTLLFLI